jgi:hypothetical protein
MASRLGLGQRPCNQRLPDPAPTERRLDGERTKQQGLGLADPDRGKPHRRDHQHPDARREGKIEAVAATLAHPIGGLGKPSGPEGALKQALDRLGVGGGLRQDCDGGFAHRLDRRRTGPAPGLAPPHII